MVSRHQLEATAQFPQDVYIDLFYIILQVVGITALVPTQGYVAIILRASPRSYAVVRILSSVPPDRLQTAGASVVSGAFWGRGYGEKPGEY